ncbi:zinc ABC transporter solute-binding protein [Candidatus Roizmanbacteria bacterium]|nr:zinc ABC transporter solute-binding protein [Candidatus Roizmanbacteria bacterium]
MNRIIPTILVIIFVFTATLFFINRTSTSNTIQISATFYPLAYFAQQIAGSRAVVINLTPSGVEPHDFEPTPQDLVKISKSHLFLFNGNGIDGWAEKIAQSLPDKVKSINISREVAKSHSINPQDPHIWLDPVLAKQEVEIITQALIHQDPQHKEEYIRNADRLNARLTSLDEKYIEGLKSCKLNEIIVAHDAFNYLGKRYRLKMQAITGISPDEEPSATKLAEIASHVRDNKVPYIFIETLSNPRFSETIAKETGAKVLELNPVEGLTTNEVQDGISYFELMNTNLKNLRIALQCE